MTAMRSKEARSPPLGQGAPDVSLPWPPNELLLFSNA